MISTAPRPNLDSARQAVEDAGLFSSLCTISRGSGTLDANGQPDMNPANFPTVTGMVDIPCMDSPEVLQRPDLTDELDTVQMTLARRTRHVLLDGLYAVLQSDIATINGTVYDVLAVEPDSQRVTTRLAVQVRVI